MIWAGTNDGKLWYTKDGGANWIDVTKNFKDLPPWGTFTQIWPSTFDPARPTSPIDFHLMDDRKPYIYKTTDFGATWKKITGNIPSGHPLDYVLSLAGNPNKKGMLFAGTGRAFYYSLDDGGTWTQFKDGPAAGAGQLDHRRAALPRRRRLDLRPRALHPAEHHAARADRADGAAPATTTQALRAGADLPAGAQRFSRPDRPHFKLALATAPSAPIQMEILDASGKVDQDADWSSAHQGLNGINWDLLYDGPTLVELRTTPPENPHIWEEPRFQDTDIRRITHWGITPQTGIPMAAPGKYQVRFTVDGQRYTQPFEVMKDPAIASSVEDLQTSTATQMRIRDDITRDVRDGQPDGGLAEADRRPGEGERGKGGARQAAERSRQRRSSDVELKLVSRSEMLSDDKYFPEAYKVYMNLIWLSGGVGQGASDEAGSIDYKPTDTQMQVLRVIEKELAAAKAASTSCMSTRPAGVQQAYGRQAPADWRNG